MEDDIGKIFIKFIFYKQKTLCMINIQFKKETTNQQCIKNLKQTNCTRIFAMKNIFCLASLLQCMLFSVVCTVLNNSTRLRTTVAAL